MQTYIGIPDEIVIEGRTYKAVPIKQGKRTHVIAILDRSGSMSGLVDSTIEGYNGFIDNLRKENVDVTTVIFDDIMETLYERLNIDSVKPLTRRQYFPRGGTALIDAVCETINDTPKTNNNKYIVLIITDGQENSSRRYTNARMKSMIERLQGKGNWTFTYMGANQDSFAEASKWGFHPGNITNFTADNNGIKDVYNWSAQGSLKTVRGASLSTTNFFKDEESL